MNDLDKLFNNIDRLLEVLEELRLEKRPVLKKKVLGYAMMDKRISNDLRVLMSILYHGILVCPKPKWKNSSQAEEGQCKAVLLDILMGDSIDTKDFHELPLKIQLVLYYSSISSDIGLNSSHLISKLEILSKYDILAILGATEEACNEFPIVDTTSGYQCPKCGTQLEVDRVCESCMEGIILATEYNVESFNVYGTSLKDFNARFMDWHLEVNDGLFKFTKLTESVERYEPVLPFEEYRKTLQLI
jgi:hypothetical protein